MFSKATLIHSIMHAVLVVFLFVSVLFNLAFMDGRIYVDHDTLRKDRLIKEVYPEDGKDSKK